ncbi:MAG: glycoside hydrolase family 3 N-terminal domain-containing protein [Bryobacteraceae bacterium]
MRNRKPWAAVCLLTMMGGLPAVAPAARRKPAKTAEKDATPAAAPNSGQVQRWLSSLTLRQKVAQLVMIPFYGEAPSQRTRAYREFERLVKVSGVGGLIVINRRVGGTIRRAEPHAMAAFLNRMQKSARLPLIVGGDFERGASMRVTDSTKFPHLMAYAAAGDTEAVKRLGAATAREARAMGVHWVFAPVADVNNNPENPIINIRSFGEDPKSVSNYVTAFVEGAASAKATPVITTVKHFPGHGDTATDSHLGLPRLEVDRERLETIEFEPFRAAIAANVDAVMTAHISIPALDPSGVPATVSPEILNGILREKLGFKGIIVTDAMDMKGLATQFSHGEAAVKALEAGADLLLMPPKPDEAIDAVVKAVKSGRLSQKRIDESVRRILGAKVKVGLQKKRVVDVDDLSDNLESEEDAEDAQNVANHAMTLVKNDNGVVPIKNPSAACYYVLAESRFGQQGARLMEALPKRAPQAKIRIFDPQESPVALQEAATEAANCDQNVVFAFVTVSDSRGDVALRGGFPAFLRQLVESRKPVILVSLGNPYLLRAFTEVAAYLASFSTAETSEIAALNAVTGEIPIQGHLPVSIPGIAKIGEGIQTGLAVQQINK